MHRLLILLIALVFSPVFATSAFGHAVLIATYPAGGSVIEAMPTEVLLEFSEPVAPLAFRLLEPGGADQELRGRGTDAKVSVEVPKISRDGTYFLEWHVVSADGHPVAGSVAISIGAPGGEVSPAGPQDRTIAVALWFATALMFAGTFFGVGATAFGAFLSDDDSAALPRRRRGVILLAGMLGLVASVPLHCADMLGVPLAAVFKVQTWEAAFATTYGAQAVGMALSIAMAAFADRLLGISRRALAVVALATLSGALVLSGHASTAEPLWLARTTLIAHVLGFSFWVGALPALVTALVRPSVRSTAVLATFSRLIIYAVGLILASGAVLAILQFGPPGAAWLSAYAAILAAKLAVLAVLFAIAAWNRFVLTRPALAGDDAAARKLRTLVLVEIALVVIVFGLVAGWRFTPPPRALAHIVVAEQQFAKLEAANQSTHTHLHGSGIIANLEVSKDGDASSLTIELDPVGPSVDIKSVHVSLTPPVERSVPLERNAIDAGGGHWTTQLPLMSTGRWAVNLEIRVGDFDLLKLKGALQFK